MTLGFLIGNFNTMNSATESFQDAKEPGEEKADFLGIEREYGATISFA